MADPKDLTSADRRRVERRISSRVADLTLPEFRRMILTSTLFAVVLLLFLWMVRTVVIAGIVAAIVAVYVRPLYRKLHGAIRSPVAAATIAIMVVIIPVILVAIYSYVELRHAAHHLQTHQAEIVARIQRALRRIPFIDPDETASEVQSYVLAASQYGGRFAQAFKAAMVQFSVALAVFFFTTAYVLTDSENIGRYIRDKIPSRYGELVAALESNVQGVLYGAIYATLVTQTIKSVVILAMNVAFDVPLAVVLAILSFIIGFFPIVGSWSVYFPVAMWLVIFRDSWGAAITMILVGFFFNTMFISMYVRPKIAAEKSRVLDFYWMFVGLVTGVYTFGIVGILLGPVIIGLLKAVFDTVTAQSSWRLLDADGDVVHVGELVLPGEELGRGGRT